MRALLVVLISFIHNHYHQWEAQIYMLDMSCALITKAKGTQNGNNGCKASPKPVFIHPFHRWLVNIL